MFEIGFPELLVIVFVGLLVVGPEKLPEIIKALTRSFGVIRSYLKETRSEIEKSVGMDEIRQDLHNEKIMEDLQKNKKESNSTE
ncbi:MAG: Sec-independent protein translocase protein TatB [SAR86 cluster bacterium]|jgi:sec-independent protein translocase protein TatB|nr:Sec-independent protein translocase protein TatB [SAR86 cluster bacterium]|tara:strand:- start:176 stop:427 length:252 start_codon:yes stop_codon:yes gene_type:complete